MRTLIISALPETDSQTNGVIQTFKDKVTNVEVIYTDKCKISHCVGCTDCWLKTPGICAVKDDFKLLLEKFIKADCVIFIAEAKLGFISYKIKNVVDRLIPLAVPYTTLHNGEMRHVSRYKKRWHMGLLFAGNGDKEYLNIWLERFALNFFSTSLGAYSIEESEGILYGIDNIQLLTQK